MDSIMDHNGISKTTGGGIVIVPGVAGSANAQITNTKLVHNSARLNLLSSGPMLAAMQGGMVATNNGDGVRAIARTITGFAEEMRGAAAFGRPFLSSLAAIQRLYL
jgi:hypothetical protein